MDSRRNEKTRFKTINLMFKCEDPNILGVTFCSAMANTFFSSPTNPQFFKPLLPGFKTHLSIPKAFYSKHLEGKEEGNTVTLISDALEITWKITLENQRLTHGWEKFVVAHNLKVGDILVFRHEGSFMFHVTPFDPSCCEIVYSHDDDNHTGMLNDNSEMKNKNPIKDDACIVTVPVTPSNVEADSVVLSKGFTTSSGLSNLCNEIILLDEKGRSSTLDLTYHESSKRFCFKHGWKAFCCMNGYPTGSVLRFILVSNGKTPALRVFPLERDEDNTSDHESAKEEENVELLSSSDDSSFVVPVTVANLSYDRLYLPMKFSRSITNEGLHKIGLMNKHGRRWTLSLGKNKSKGQFSIGGGWRSFCEANGLKAGCSISFKPARHGTNLVLLMNETLKAEGV